MPERDTAPPLTANELFRLAEGLLAWRDDLEGIYDFCHELFADSQELMDRVLAQGWGIREEYRALFAKAEAKVMDILESWIRGRALSREVARLDLSAELVSAASSWTTPEAMLAGLDVIEREGLDLLARKHAQAGENELRTLARAARGLGVADASRFVHEYLGVVESASNLFLWGELCLSVHEARATPLAVDDGVVEQWRRELGSEEAWAVGALADLQRAVATADWTRAWRLASELNRRCLEAARRLPARIAALNTWKRANGARYVHDELAMCTALRRLGRFRCIGLYHQVAASAGLAGDAALVDPEIEAARSLPFSPEDTRPLVSVAEVLADPTRHEGETVWVEGYVGKIESRVRRRERGYMHYTQFALHDLPGAEPVTVYSHGHFMADNGLRTGAFFRGAVVVESQNPHTGAPQLNVLHLRLEELKAHSWLGYSRWAVRAWWDDFYSWKEAASTYEQAPRDLSPPRPDPWEVVVVEYAEVNAQADIFLGPPDVLRVTRQWWQATGRLLRIASIGHDALDTYVSSIRGAAEAGAGASHEAAELRERHLALAELQRSVAALRQNLRDLFLRTDADLSAGLMERIRNVPVEMYFPL